MSVPAALLKEFILSLSGKAGTTVDAYQRELRNFLDWISQRAGNSGPFDAQQQLTKTALQCYLTHLQSEGRGDVEAQPSFHRLRGEMCEPLP